MSKRAEKKADEFYRGSNPYREHPEEDWKREGFIDGYEEAERDTIERAKAWLKEHANNYIVDITPTYPDAPQELIIGGKCWDDLQKAMEEE